MLQFLSIALAMYYLATIQSAYQCFYFAVAILEIYVWCLLEGLNALLSIVLAVINIDGRVPDKTAPSRGFKHGVKGITEEVQKAQPEKGQGQVLPIDPLETSFFSPPIRTDIILRPKCGSSYLPIVLDSTSIRLVQWFKHPEPVSLPSLFAGSDLHIKMISLVSAGLDLGLVPVVPCFKDPKAILSLLTIATQFEVVSAVTGSVSPNMASGFPKPGSKRLMTRAALDVNIISEAPLTSSSHVGPSTPYSAQNVEQFEVKQQKVAVQTQKRGAKKTRAKKAHKKWQKARD